MKDDDEDEGAKVLVFRNSATGAPIAVPEAIVEENDRTYRAAQMHLRGASWKAVALAEGYLDSRAAQSDVRRYMDEARALIGEYTRAELLQTEVARIDALQAAAWDQAMKGHLPAGKFVLDCIITRVKTLQLDQPAEGEDLTGPRTVVIPLSDEDYLASLQKASADAEPEQK